jgi:predicted nucleic acid-binding protein
MTGYADTSFLIRIYSPHADSDKALKWMQRATDPLPFTQLHRHEVRTGLRLRVFRGEMTIEQRKQAFEEIESDLEDNILVHAPVSWADAFREAERISSVHTEVLGVRGFDLLHIALATVLGTTEFLTFDSRQATLAKAVGLHVKF